MTQIPQRCEQCGREGTRGFTTIGGFVICVSTATCRRRYEKQRPPHDPEAELQP